MTTRRTTELPGEKMRKAIEEFCELQKQQPAKTRGELIEMVSRKFDLSPLEHDFLIRQLDNR